MNRPIKFRARTLDGSWIYTSPEVMFNFAGEFAYLPGKGEGATIVPLVKGTIAQYTGLKDKNGIEVYDGDLIRQVGWTEPDDSMKQFMQGIAQLEYERSRHGKASLKQQTLDRRWDEYRSKMREQFERPFVVEWVGIGFEPFLSGEEAEFEVIGDIYENPELLEAKS